MERDRRIVLEWTAGNGRDTRIEMLFESLGDADTLVSISESGWRASHQPDPPPPASRLRSAICPVW